jgi:hypothetical protein
MCSGELQSVDGYMNIALEDTKEVVNGRVRKNYGDAFIRGNNGEWFGRSVLKTSDAYDVLQSCISQQMHERVFVESMRESKYTLGPAIISWDSPSARCDAMQDKEEDHP